MPIPVWALTIGAFGIGTGEFVMVGLLPRVARDLDVSPTRAGLLVSGYAMGVVVGAPLMAALTRRLPRKTTLLAMMGLFVAGNLLCAVAPGYHALLAARVITALAHATFFGIGSVVAAELAGARQKASAIAAMFSGVTLANVVGVPLGTFVGQSVGWRTTYAGVSVLGVLALMAVAVLVPRMGARAPAPVLRELQVLIRPRVLLVFAVTILTYASLLALLTYVALLLVRIGGFSEGSVSAILLLFGGGFVVGNAAGGKLADRALMPTLCGFLALLAVVLAAFSITIHHQGLALVTMFLLGVAGFGVVPALQLRAVAQAEGAPNLASSANIAAFNLGNAAGAYLGGQVLERTGGLESIPWVAALITVGALGAALVSGYLDRRAART
ncbi:MAG: MFS transporter [Polyangiaceae bacterium]|nr:MFS transporter [Polyangiaceae bacterium]